MRRFNTNHLRLALRLRAPSAVTDAQGHASTADPHRPDPHAHALASTVLNAQKACSIPQLLADTRATLPYPESAITYSAGADRVLTVWYVDSTLDPTAEGKASLIALENLVTNASMMAIRPNHWSWPCMWELLDYLHALVVDRKYTGWFSGFISTDDLTSMTVPRVHRAEGAEYIVEYVRQGPAPALAPAPEAAYSWAEAHERIHQHVGPPDRNLGFYMYVDRSGVTVWAQWDESAELEQLN